MNSILYFLDPRTELNDKLFRYATLRSHIIPEIKGLKEFDSNLDIKIVMSQSIFNEAKKNLLNLNNIECLIVDEDLFDKLNIDSNSISVDLYKERISNKNKRKLVSIISKSLPDGFCPDIIISYESPANFLKDIFPTSLLLNSMFGLFSRAPFPAFGLLDPCGLYEQSYQNKFALKIKKEKISSDEVEVINLLRKKTTLALAKYHPLKKYLSGLTEKFDRLVVLACQVENYFSYDGCSNYKSHYEMVDDVLANAPENIGVIVTEHSYKKQLTDENIKLLKNKYRNFIYFDNSNIPTVTQFILPYVDGALSVSSSIGYQAGLWHLPYLSLGRSQISLFDTHDKFDGFFEAVNSGERFNNDNVIYFLLSRIHLSHKNDIFNGGNYYKILTSFLQKHRDGICESEFFSEKKSIHQVREDIVSGNREWLLKKNFIDQKINPEIDHLRVAMANSKAISFDLFDTLAERDFVEPHELFNLIEPRIRKLVNNKNFQFYYIRRQSEIDLRRESRGEFEITLDQIYERFSRYCSITNDDLEKIKNIEIAAEIELVHPKKEMVREYYFAKLHCKSVSIITDIYLNEKVIKSILEKIGISDYNHLLVSAESKTRKHNGTIYPEYLDILSKNYGIDASECLHIGDNKQADGLMAKKHGLKSYVFPKAMDNYKQSLIAQAMRGSLNQLGVSSSIINGLFANKYNAGHWFKVNKDSLFKSDEYNYGYMAIGPLVAGFTQWLYRRAKKLGIKELYFLSRDGWVLKQAYDRLYSHLSDSPKSHYLYSSRRTAMVASIRTVSDIVEVASQNFNARKLSDFLESRFGVDANQISDKTFSKYGFKKDSMVSPYFENGKLIEFLKDIADVIIDNSNVERNAYLDYLNDEGFIKACLNKSVAVVDIGYSGSMQYYLKKTTECEILHGFYFLTHHHSRDYFEDDHFEGFLQNLDDHKISYRHGLNDHVFIFEAALSSPEGSLIKIEGTGKNRKLVFLEAEEEIIRRDALLRTHHGVMAFINELKARFGSYTYDIEFSSLLSSHLILNFANNPNCIDAKIFVDHEVENVFGGGSVCLISPVSSQQISNQGLINAEILDQLIKSSKWKKGAEIYYRGLAKNEKTLITSQIKTFPQPPRPKPTYAHQPKTTRQRKLAKLKNDPYLFFSDAKNPAIKKLNILFKTDTALGKISTSIIKKVMN